LHGVLAHRNVLSAGDAQPCEAVLQEYGLWIAEHCKPKTVALRDRYLQLWIDEYGHLPVRGLTPQHLERFIRKYQEPRRSVHPNVAVLVCHWGPGSRRVCTGILLGAFSWAVRSRIITENPLRGVRMGANRSRGREALLTEEDHQKLLAVAPQRMKELLTALNE